MERAAMNLHRSADYKSSDVSIGADVNSPMEPSMHKPEKQQKPLNDLSRSLTPFDPNQTLTAVVERAAIAG